MRNCVYRILASSKTSYLANVDQVLALMLSFGHLLKYSSLREIKRIEGTGTQVRIQTVAFAAKRKKGLEQKFSATSTLLRLTGLGGRADGQFK